MPSSDPLESTDQSETVESTEQQERESKVEETVPRPAPRLDSLLKDKQFASSVSLPKTQLTAPKPSVWESKWFAISLVGGLIAVAVIVLVVTLILVN